MKKVTTSVMVLTLLVNLHSVKAENITFGKIVSPKAFQQYWGLTQEQMQQYESYMQVAGKYRHKDINPLVVLSIIADDDEDKDYFASKAAQYESQMSKREILSAWLITSSMEKQGYSDAMQKFSDGLIGIDSQHYVPESVTADWQKGDELAIVVDKLCYEMHCLPQFEKVLTAIPKHIKKTIIYRSTDMDKATQDAFTTSLKQLQDKLKTTTSLILTKYDRIEHGLLQHIRNQAVHIRNNEILKKL